MTTKKNTQPRDTSRQPGATGKGNAISWTTDIAHTPRRWWWYVGVVWIGLLLFGMLLTAGHWDLATVTLVAVVALLVVNVGKPRTWRVTITDEEVHVQRPGHGSSEYRLPLNEYRAFTVVDMPANRGTQPQRAIALMPRSQAGAAQTLVLPADPKAAEGLITRLTTHLSYEEHSSYARRDRVLDKVARLLGIS